PELFQLSRDYVGDTAETIALIWDQTQPSFDPTLTSDPASSERYSHVDMKGGITPLQLGEVISQLALIDRASLGARLESWLDGLGTTERWALLKLLTGALRVGVSARLAKTAVAEMGARDVTEIEEVWHAIAPPYEDLFAWIEGRAPIPDVRHALVFR